MAGSTEHADTAGLNSIKHDIYKIFLHIYVLYTTALPCSSFIILQSILFSNCFMPKINVYESDGTTEFLYIMGVVWC